MRRYGPTGELETPGDDADATPSENVDVEEPEGQVVDVDALPEAEEEAEAPEEEEEQPSPDEVEESLDHFLEVQFEGEEDLSPEMAEEREEEAAALATAAPPPLADFLCRGCFLRKATSQLADPTARLCKDCANPR